MASPYKYKRRKPSLIRNLWIYRRLVLASMILGVLLWFLVINRHETTVYFPFGLGTHTGSTALVILLSALAGSAITALLMTLFLAVRRFRSPGAGEAIPENEAALPAERPPTDYAAKTAEGFS